MNSRKLPTVVVVWCSLCATVVLFAVIVTNGFRRARAGDDLPLALGIPAHRIPAIFEPRFVAASLATLANDAPVVGVAINSHARAYPLHLLNRHEAVNDVVGGVPILVTRCTECRSTMVFSRVVNGEARTFGVSGDLLDGAQVLYDVETRTLWRHRDGAAVRGRDKGARLQQEFAGGTVVKSVRWGNWRVRYARTLLLWGDAADTFSEGSPNTSGDR